VDASSAALALPVDVSCIATAALPLLLLLSNTGVVVEAAEVVGGGGALVAKAWRTPFPTAACANAICELFGGVPGATVVAAVVDVVVVVVVVVVDVVDVVVDTVEAAAAAVGCFRKPLS